MSENKKAASGAANTTDSKANQPMASVAQPKGGVNLAGQYTAIRMAYHAAEKLARKKNDPLILSQRVDTLVKQFAPYGFTREQVISIGSGSFGDNDADFSRPVIEHKHPTVWTPEEETQLRVMKEKGVANSEICKQLHKTPQQVSSKWCFMRSKAAKPSEKPTPDKPVSVPASKPESQVKQASAYTPTPAKHQSSLPYAALKEYRLFDLMQKIMAANRFTRLTLTAVNEHGTQYRAEVRKP
jgi:hypothetical protein